MIGLLDDLVLVTLGLAVALQLIPAEILEEHRAEAAHLGAAGGVQSRTAATVVVGVWLFSLAGVAFWS